MHLFTRNLLIFCLFCLAGLSCGRVEDTPITLIPSLPAKDSVPEETAAFCRSFGIPLKAYQMEGGIVKKNENFAKILLDKGIEYNTIHEITQEAAPVFDLRKLRVGNAYTWLYDPNSETPVYFIYEETVRAHICFALEDSLWVSRTEIPIQVEERFVEVTIQQSLWQDLEEGGYNPMVANTLSEVYAWTIDFFGLQKGDKVKVYYNAYLLKDREIEPGPITAASFTHAGKTYLAFRYVQDSMTGYWNEKGENLQKAFLKAPLKYSRISSGFSYARRHPITRIVRPHTGVDYAAPKGTPVMSIGEGTVIEKRYAGGGGNTVKIKHNGVYTTAYLHLSKYAKGLVVGKRVSQGEVIGYVGSTGSSTGPHLDFRVWQNGKPVNPLKMESPPADPIAQANLASFTADTGPYYRSLIPGYYSELVERILEPLGLTTLRNSKF